jgi:nicotinamidase-related amidase
MPRRALIIIDLQNDYFAGGRWVLEGADAAAANTARLLEAARRADDLVVHIRHEFPNADAPFFAPGSSGAEIHDSVRPLEGEPVIVKQYANAFRETTLQAMLEQEGITDLTICGAMSHMCVDAGTRAAADLGYPITVVHDACATRDLEFEGTTVPAAHVHAAYMSALGFAYASVCSTDAYLAAVAAESA